MQDRFTRAIGASGRVVGSTEKNQVAPSPDENFSASKTQVLQLWTTCCTSPNWSEVPPQGLEPWTR